MPSNVTAPPCIVVDLAAGRLRIDDRTVEIRPKTWEVLCALVERPGQLLTKNELLDRVWADTAVSEGTLNKSIGELRAALEDNRDAPRCIETVPRRGFRWIGKVQVVAVPGSAGAAAAASAVAAGPGAQQAAAPASSLVARADEIAMLDAALDRARSGRRQVLFITGEAGAGKTTLVDHFLARLARGAVSPEPLVAHGQCLETSGMHEPYLPLLDALERLARDPVSGDAVVAVLRRWAPAWVAQLPSLAPSGDAAAGNSPAPGSMLRELVTALDEIARQRPLVVVLEDAHWADLATTDACAALARRRDPAQLLLLITKRTAEAMLTEHPVVAVRRDLVTRQAAEEISLAPFVSGDVGAYLQSRCPGLANSGETVDWLLQQTAGNPLFVRLVLDEWMSRGLVAADEAGQWSPCGGEEEMRQTVPDSLRALLERQVARLAPPERALLEAASVRVGTFHAASIARAAGLDADEADALCELIARRGQLLRDAGEAMGADGRLAPQYAFLHATVQNVVVAGLASARRRRLHLAAAEQLELENAGRTQGVAALLAVHYEAAGDVAKTVSNQLAAAKLAMHRDAPRDGIVILENALALIDSTPSLPLEEDRVLVMRFMTHARQLAYGFTDERVREMWARTIELAAANENPQETLVASAGRIVGACVAGSYAEADEVIVSALPLMSRVRDGGALKTFLFAAGTTRYRMAMMVDSCAMFDEALAMPHEGDPIPGNDMDALLMSQYAPAVALGGRIEELHRISGQSLARARVHSHYSECVTAALVAWALAIVGDHEAALPIAERALEIARDDDFPTWFERPLLVLGLSNFGLGRQDEGLAQIRESFEDRKQKGQVCDHSAMCCLAAEALMDAGRPGAGELVAEAAAFVAATGELFAETELQRLQVRLLRQGGAGPDEAETRLRRALDLAQLRGLHWSAMRIASDLAALLGSRGRAAEGRTLLEPALAAIRGGDRLRRVRESRDLLAAL